MGPFHLTLFDEIIILGEKIKMNDNYPDSLTVKGTFDLEQINYIMNNMEKGRVYDLSGAQCDGYLATNVANLRKYLNELSAIIQIHKLGVKEPKKLFKSYDESAK